MRFCIYFVIAVALVLIGAHIFAQRQEQKERETCRPVAGAALTFCIEDAK